jgi:hypothetical protein
MHLKLIARRIFAREFEHILARSQNTVDLELIPMGLHSLGVEMRPHLQERLDVSDRLAFDAILLSYALCGRGTEGLRGTKMVLLTDRELALRPWSTSASPPGRGSKMNLRTASFFLVKDNWNSTKARIKTFFGHEE